MAKTLSYNVMHITIAVALAYIMTGNLAIALGIGILEPVVQSLAFPLHEWLWERKQMMMDRGHEQCLAIKPPSDQSPTGL